MVGISRISGRNRISDDNNPILNNFAKSNNLIEEELNNVTSSAAVREVGDEDYLSPEPPAAAPAEGSKEEAEDVSYSATIPKGMTAVEQLTDGRISVPGYALYTGIMTALLGLVQKSEVSHTTFVIHTVSGVSMWIVNFLIVFWVLTAREGQLISTGWSLWLERILYFTLAAGPFILLHCLLAQLYTCEGPVVMAGVGSTCRSVWEYCIQQLFTNGWGEDDLTNLLEEAGLTHVLEVDDPTSDLDEVDLR